ncbi:hypothetical protein H4R27_002336 [Coemansia aciculifera]|nr:hypothetical protein H4R27_002336 [Coemansia aciculifera]
MSTYLTTLGVGLVVDAVVACLAVLCLLTSKFSWYKVTSKRPATAAASFANVALLVTTSAIPTGRFAVSVAAALTLSMYSAASLSRGNLQACLHLARALSTAFNFPLLSLPVGATSAFTHLLIAWQFLDPGKKALIVRLVYDFLNIRGVALIMQGKRRPFTVEDIRDSAAEDEFCRQCKSICDDTTQMYVTCLTKCCKKLEIVICWFPLI